MAEINETAITAALGEHNDKFTLTTSSTGNVQVNIKNLGGTRAYDQCKLLCGAADALVQAGYTNDPNDIVRLSFRTEDDAGNVSWRPYPCIWVNKPTAAQTEMQALQKSNSEMKSVMDQLLEKLSNGKTAEVEESATTEEQF